jgi:cytochrome P450
MHWGFRGLNLQFILLYRQNMSEVAPLPLTSAPERARDPHAYFRARRAEGPVQFLQERGNEQPTAVIVDGQAVYEALHDDAYTARGSVSYGRVRPIIPTHVDPPEHTRYRRMLDPLMRQSEMVKLTPHITARCDALIDAFLDRDACEFIADFAIPLPGATFLSLFGLPEQDLEFLLEFKNNVMRPVGATPEQQRQRQQVWSQRAEEHFARLIEQARRHPGDDVISKLVRADADGARLTDLELLDICFQLVLGGLDTVTAALGLMWTYLAAHPDQRRVIVDDPARQGAAVEELLRWATPVTAVKRRAVRDVDVAGCPIAAGQPVHISIFSANADPARFPEPETVDFERHPNRHNAFGGGIHRCLGSHLARIELTTALQAWHRRIPDYRIVDPDALTFSDGNAIRSVDRLPLAWSM